MKNLSPLNLGISGNDIQQSDSTTLDQVAQRVVLLCYDISDASTTQVIGAANADGAVQILRSQLERMGYTAHIMFITNTSQFFADFAKSSQGYEFIVMANISFGYADGDLASAIFRGEAKIPVFALGQYAQSTTTAGRIGLNRITTRDYRWCTHVSSGATIPMYTSEMDALDATVAASIDALVTIDQPVGAPVYLPKLIAAGRRRGVNNNVYFDCAGLPNRSTLFPLLLQEAINDGKLQPPTYKLTGAFDVDDMPEESPMKVSDCEQLYALQQRYKIPITWGMKTSAAQIAAINHDTFAFVAARTPDKGGLIYAIEHDGDDYWSENSDTTIETQFLEAIARAQAVGLRLGWDGYDSWGYRFFNTNAINQNGLNICAKYGINVARTNRGVKAPRNHTDKWIRPIGRGNSITEYKGVMCIESATYIDLTDRYLPVLQEPGRGDVEVFFSNANTSVEVGDVLTQGGVTGTITEIRIDSGSLASGDNTGRIRMASTSGGAFSIGAATSTGGGALNLTTNSYTYALLKYTYTYSMWNDFCLAKGAPLYFHGDNFYYGHNGGNAPGHLILEAIAAACHYASDVMAIVHPSQFRIEHHSKFSYLSE